MPLKIKIGTIKKVSLTSDPYYDVHFEDGSVLRVFHRLVQPASVKLLIPGCRLSVGINEGRVEWASTDLTTPERKEDKKERFPPGKYIVTVKDVNPSKGIVTVATIDGITIRVRLQKHEQIWSKVFMGRKLELEVICRPGWQVEG